MMRSLFSGISGLKSHQTRMDVIGNNIANVNTAGYKSSRATFSDMLSQTITGASAPTGAIGGTNAKQIGLGVNVGSIDQIMADGSPQSTGKSSDLAISGNGFFVMKQGTNEKYYTRDGAFEFDQNGDFVLPGSGLYVQGWNLKEGATVIDTNAAVENVNVKVGKVMDAKQTTATDCAGNLDSGSLLSVDASQTNAAIIYNPLFGTTGYTGQATQARAPENSLTTSVTAYDAYGNAYSIPILLAKYSQTTNQGCKWGAALPETVEVKNYSGDVIATMTIQSATFADEAGTAVNGLVFDNLGRLTNATDALGNIMDTVLTITASVDTGAVAPISQTFTVTYGYADLTQYAGSNTLHEEAKDAEAAGYASGTLKSVSFDTTGVVTGVYTNGMRRAEAQVAIAQFANSAGLMRTSGSLFQESNNSGKANIRTAVDLGVSLTPGSLEMSNVDVANEFADMIVTQRGFQSNSKIITVGDEMLETVINMKR